jgi:hypothetical protein
MMTPEQKVKWLIIDKFNAWSKKESLPYPADDIDSAYDALVESDDHWDARNDIRCGDIETDITSPSSRHYESKSVAAKMPDNTWVGWTCWYGGGKHAEPEAIDWMDEAYNLDCKEHEKVVTVREFSKTE